MTSLNLAVASDHAGVELKKEVLHRLNKYGVKVMDLSSTEDYPDIASNVVHVILHHGVDYGILFCGTGIGMSIAANRYHGVRAAHCHDTTSVRFARQHNNINILTLGARLVGSEVAWDCVKTFLETPFSGEERHQRRIAKLDQKVCT